MTCNTSLGALGSCFSLYTSNPRKNQSIELSIHFVAADPGLWQMICPDYPCPRRKKDETDRMVSVAGWNEHTNSNNCEAKNSWSSCCHSNLAYSYLSRNPGKSIRRAMLHRSAAIKSTESVTHALLGFRISFRTEKIFQSAMTETFNHWCYVTECVTFCNVRFLL